ncbi:MAG: hypothetical protein V1880_03040, partial [Patescibacteria group bacterium]
AKHEMRLYFEPDAVALHHHQIPDSALENRMRAVGRSAVIFEKLQPKVRVIPRGLKAILLKIVTQPSILAFIRFFGGINSYYKFKTWQQFLKGANMC